MTLAAPSLPTAPSAADTGRGIALMLVATALLVISDTFIKHLVSVLPWPEVVWGRLGVQVLVVFAWLGRRLPATLATRRPGLQVLRSSLLAGATGCFFIALQVIPLADGQAVMAFTPLIVTALSVPLLKETVGWRRWMAVGFGFVGALIIVRPGASAFGWYGLLPLVSATCFGVFQIITRRLAGADSAETTLAYTALVGAVAFTPALFLVWQTPTAAQAVMMVTSGSLATLAHFFLIRAFILVPASVATPFTYTTLVWATICGFIVFGDFPDGWTFLGAGLIVGGGLYVLHREQQRRRQGPG